MFNFGVGTAFLHLIFGTISLLINLRGILTACATARFCRGRCNKYLNFLISSGKTRDFLFQQRTHYVL